MSSEGVSRHRTTHDGVVMVRRGVWQKEPRFRDV